MLSAGRLGLTVACLACCPSQCKIGLSPPPGLVDVRLVASDGRCRFGVATSGQRTLQLLEAGIRLRRAIVHDAAQLINRAGVEWGAGDRLIELPPGGFGPGPSATATLYAARARGPVAPPPAA